MLKEQTRNGLEYPILRHNGQDYDLSQLDRDTLLGLRLSLEQEIDKINSQLGEAKLKRHTTGEFADPSWFLRANVAKKRLGRMAQVVQQEIGKRPKQARRRHLSQYFMDAARVLLNVETFEMLHQEALARQESDQYDS